MKKKLDNEFIIKFDDPNPDYLIYSVYNNEDINPNYTKSNPIRIADYHLENIFPDLNYADYALAHFHINYLDKYFKYQTLFLRKISDINQIREKVIKEPIRKKFCAAVISNCYSIFRLDFIKKLNNYKKVDMGGHCKNNINKTVSNKIEFLSQYKFSIAMENSKGDGYISEKIIDSFNAGTIPIYFGDYIIDEFINPKTYILVKGVADINKKIEYIKRIDKDDNLYISFLKEKPIIDSKFKNKIEDKEVKTFFKNIFNQDKNKAYRRDNSYYDFNCKKNKT